MPRHRDRRLRLKPRQYVVDPSLFGVDPAAPFHVHAGGDEASMHSAVEQHLLFSDCDRCRRPGVEALGQRFDMSKQIMSKSSLGQRWACHVVLAALLYATRQQR
jgi:hypothetical protein